MSGVLKVERHLEDLVPFVQLDDSWKKTVVTGLAVDSRKVKEGFCFLAYPGHQSDGRAFVSAAVASGAGSVLVEADGFERVDCSVPVVAVPDLKGRLGEIASEYYGNPSAGLKLLAITGTNGKTSVSQLVAQALESFGQRAGVIGTLGNGLLGELSATVNTTPDVVDCNRLLADMKAAGARFVSMETSSHGLIQGRVDGLTIYTALVTNISRDHLDYHGTMDAYCAAKTLLVTHPGLQHVVLNWDDARVVDMAKSVHGDTKLWTFSLQNRDDVTVGTESIHYGKQGIEMVVRFGAARATLKSELIGEFNGANLLASLTLLLASGVDLAQAVAALSAVKPVVGRMQRVLGAPHQPMVIIDFAHTPDALEKALLALRRHADRRIWCVFGCGGDRDSGKRPLMAEVVAELADEFIVTTDNPRSESFATIVADIVKGIPQGVAFQVIEDRMAAVAYAIGNASAHDVVLIAGKGHEDYQEVAGEKLPYSDLNAAQAALQTFEMTTRGAAE